MPEDFIPITRLSPVIRDLAGCDGPGYRRLHILACDGKIPAVQVGRNWGVYRRDLAATLAALDLAPANTATL